MQRCDIALEVNRVAFSFSKFIDHFCNQNFIIFSLIATFYEFSIKKTNVSDTIYIVHDGV